MYATNKKNAEAREQGIAEGFKTLTELHAGEQLAQVPASELLYHRHANPCTSGDHAPVLMDALADHAWDHTPVIVTCGTTKSPRGTVIIGEERLRVAQRLGLTLPVIWREYPSDLETDWAHLVGGWRPVKRSQESLARELSLAMKLWAPLAEERMRAGRKLPPMGRGPIGSEKGATRENVARYFGVGTKMVDASVWVAQEVAKLPVGDRGECQILRALRAGDSPMVVKRRCEIEAAQPSEDAVKAPCSEFATELGERLKTALSVVAIRATPAGGAFVDHGEAFISRKKEVAKGAVLPPAEWRVFTAARQAFDAAAMSNRALKAALEAHKANLNHAVQTLAAWNTVRTSTADPAV